MHIAATTATVPTMPATCPASMASRPSPGPTTFWLSAFMATGRLPVLSTVTRSLASWGEKPAPPPASIMPLSVISPLSTGADWMIPSSTMAMLRPRFSPVSRPMAPCFCRRIWKSTWSPPNFPGPTCASAMSSPETLYLSSTWIRSCCAVAPSPAR